MTREHVKQMLPILTAYAEGKEIQYKFINREEWQDTAKEPDLSFNNNVESYRIKPSATYRPWKPEEVPVGALFKRKTWDKNEIGLIIHVITSGLFVSRIELIFTFEEVINDTYSLDQGKTWLPCGVLVEEGE